MSEPLISIIVPVYNTERFLRRCLDSLICQTYPYLEIILINDGSTDGSKGICEEYQRKHKNIILSNQENRGVSAARNTGLAKVQGKYIGFVDSDDWVAPETYGYALQLLEKYHADIVQFDFITSSEKNIETSQEKLNEEIYYNKNILQYYMLSSTKETGGYLMSRVLVKREHLNGLLFREGKINEDIDFKYKMLERCNTMVVSNNKLYYYFQNPGSISRNGLKRRDFDLYDAAEELCRLADKETYADIRSLAYVKKARTPFSLLCKISYFGIEDKSIERETTIKRLTREHRKSLYTLLNSPLPLSRKVLAVSYAISFPLTDAIIKIAKRTIGYI